MRYLALFLMLFSICTFTIGCAEQEADTPAADTPPADTPPADTPPADTPPADTPPAEPPVE